MDNTLLWAPASDFFCFAGWRFCAGKLDFADLVFSKNFLPLASGILWATRLCYAWRVLESWEGQKDLTSKRQGAADLGNIQLRKTGDLTTCHLPAAGAWWVRRFSGLIRLVHALRYFTLLWAANHLPLSWARFNIAKHEVMATIKK